MSSAVQDVQASAHDKTTELCGKLAYRGLSTPCGEVGDSSGTHHNSGAEDEGVGILCPCGAARRGCRAALLVCVACRSQAGRNKLLSDRQTAIETRADVFRSPRPRDTLERNVKLRPTLAVAALKMLALVLIAIRFTSRASRHDAAMAKKRFFASASFAFLSWPPPQG